MGCAEYQGSILQRHALFRISDSFRIARFHAALLVVSMAAMAAVAQAPQSKGKPTERVVRQYEKLIADGALLTPEGWKNTSRIFACSNPYAKDEEVLLTSQAGLIGETWVRGDRAEVERKWTDFKGSIDSDLRYKPAHPNMSSVLPANLRLLSGVHQQAHRHRRRRSNKRNLEHLGMEDRRPPT